MPEARAIFRKSALEHHASAAEQAVLPRFHSSRVDLALWALVGLSFAGLVLVARVEVPVHASFEALVVPWNGDAPLAGRTLALAILLPPAGELPASGSELGYELPATGERVLATLTSVESTPLSAVDIQRRFALSGAAAAAVDGPARLGLAPFDPPGATPASAWSGSVLHVALRTGSRRAVTFLPGVDALHRGRP